jgi:DHA1 family tetracycline resistance protein-like MFS transporter
MSVAALSGIIAPLVFGGVYAATVGVKALLDAPCAAFGLAAVILLGGALLGGQVARSAAAQD